MTSPRGAIAGLIFLLVVLVAGLGFAVLFGFSLGSLLAPFGFTGSAAAAPLADKTPTKVEVVQNAIDGYLRPAYADLAVAAAAIETSQGNLCKEPGRDALLAVRKDFATLVTAFSRVEFVRFGPIMEDNRIERVLFWPDRRGVALRQIQAIIAAEDETAADPASLRSKSVAVQGLGALEFVLFGTGTDQLTASGGSFRCRYGAAIAANLSGIAADVAAGWAAEDGIARSMTQPTPLSPAYRDIDDSLQEIVGVFIHGFEALRDLRLKPALGESTERAAPNAFLYRRSDLTETSLHANFSGLSTLYDQSRIADLLPEPQRWMKASIAFEFGNSGRIFQTIAIPLRDAIVDVEGRDRVGYLVILTQSLQNLFAEQLAPTLGLSTGFSALDGD